MSGVLVEVHEEVVNALSHTVPSLMVGPRLVGLGWCWRSGPRRYVCEF